MSIKTKLLSLIVAIMLSFILLFLGYYSAISTIEGINDETKILEFIRGSLIDETIKINGLMTDSYYIKTVDELFVTAEKTITLFEDLKTIVYIRRKSKNIDESLKIISELNILRSERMIDFQKSDILFKKSIKEVFVFIDSFTMVDIYNRSDRLDKVEDSKRISFEESLKNFISARKVYLVTLDSSINEISNQFETINLEIDKIKKQTYITISIVVFIIIVIIFLGSTLFANGIVKNIRLMEKKISYLKEGDLTVVTTIKSNDDLSRVNNNLTVFQEKIKSIIHSIQGISEENVNIQKKQLLQVEDTEKSSLSIQKSSSDIKNNIGLLDNTAKKSHESVQFISEKIDKLNNSIIDQTSMVEESTVSIIEMMASIATIDQVTQKKLESLKIMIESMNNGITLLSNSSENIIKIEDSIETIHKMTLIINEVSSQTNVLAINAEIEAAHAGEYGKGFSVVSDEIRKMAETSSNSSKEINSSVLGIIDNIKTASSSSRITSETFTEILNEVQDLFSSLNEIGMGLVELKTGGEQIQIAMGALQTITVEVKHDSDEITKQSQSVQEASGNIQSISGNVHIEIDKVSDEIVGISESISNLRNLTEVIGTVSERIYNELIFFKT